jgi:adenylate cyclase
VTPTVNATFVFADLAGFTALTDAHGDEQAAAVVADFGTACLYPLPATGGRHVKGIGDAVMLCIPDPGAAVLLGLRITHDGRAARLRGTWVSPQRVRELPPDS